MVVLKNITKTENNISADYYPEGRAEKGFMSMSLKTARRILVTLVMS